MDRYILIGLVIFVLTSLILVLLSLMWFKTKNGRAMLHNLKMANITRIIFFISFVFATLATFLIKISEH
ncbi:MAG: hypothetical protein H0V01_14625 [Bacteroidetes bacterium]|nr:hypothetical protein [Bacteroidota bacterium]HET6242919.1 hypothetical protein [Bacteroidia bacterium]